VAPEPNGSIRVVVESSGPSLDPNGYTVSIDGTWIRSIASNGSVTHAVTPGYHDVRLEDVSSNCVVQGDAVRVAVISGASSAEVRFTIQCTTAKGSIAVRVATTRPELAAAGHRVVLDGLDTVAVAANDSVEFRAVPDGTHKVELIGATSFCYVVDRGSLSVGVSGTPVLVELQVTCAQSPAGDLLVDRKDAIERLDPNSGTAVIVVSAGRGGRWSPDRQRIVYSMTGASGSHVAVLALGAPAAADLTEGTDPSWSPDGSRIVFVRSDGLYVTNADGSGLQRLLELGGIAGPVWSPDGGQIAFARARSCTVSVLVYPCSDVFLVRADGTGVSRLTTNGGRQPAWSPTGSHLVYVRGGTFLTPGTSVLRLDLSTRIEQTLTSSAGALGSPVMSPDGGYLAIAASLADGTSDIELLPLGGGPAVWLHRPGATPTSWR
jgi:hypothetical protein